MTENARSPVRQPHGRAFWGASSTANNRCGQIDDECLRDKINRRWPVFGSAQPLRNNKLAMGAVFAALGLAMLVVPLASGETASLVSYEIVITHYCGSNVTAQTKSSATGNISINESPFGCESNRGYSVKGQAIPNIPASFQGSLSDGLFSFTPASSASVTLDANFTTGSNDALKTDAQVTISYFNSSSGGQGQFSGNDNRDSLPPNSTTHLHSVGGGSQSTVLVDSQSMFEIGGTIILDTLVSGFSDTYTGVQYSITAKYKVADSAGGLTISSLDQKVGASGSSIRINIHGQNFTANSLPQFLVTGSNSVDPKMVVSQVKVVSATQITAILSIDDTVTDGLKTLRVTAGGKSAKLDDAFFAGTFGVILSQGGPAGGPPARVANHATLIRAGPFHEMSGPHLPDKLTGALYVFDGEAQIPGSPFLTNKPREAGTNSDGIKLNGAWDRDDTFFMRDTANFYFGLPSSLPSYDALGDGSYLFAYAFSPSDPANSPTRLLGQTRTQLQANRDFSFIFTDTPQKFVTTKSFHVLVATDPRLSIDKANALYDFHARDLEYLGSAYPIDNSRSNLILRRTELATLDIDDLKPPPARRRHWTEGILDRLTEILSNVNTGRPAEQQFDKIVLLLQQNDFAEITAPEDLAGLGRINGVAAMLGTSKESTFSHELGHTLGLSDTYDLSPPPRNPVNPRRADALSDGNLVESGTERLAPLHAFGSNYLAVGQDVKADGEPLPSIPYQFRSMMGSAQVRWPDAVEWKYLYERFSLPGSGSPIKGASSGVRSISAPLDVINVHGFIDTANSIDVTGIRHAILPPVNSVPGDFILELLDGPGRSLSATSFAVDFVVPDEGLVTETSFNVTVPYANGAAKVRIRRGSNVLFSKSISGHAPSVQILSSLGGKTLSGPFTISWAGSDADGDSLSYSIVYLRDDGMAVPVADQLAGTSFQWQHPSASGGSNSGRIIITANDGVNEGSATSPAFSVSKSSPVVTILSPQNGSAVPAGTTVVLSGAGFDAEDGYLPSRSLSFRSSINGNLGTGAIVTAKLSQGTHTIFLRGVDNDGKATETSITLVVGGATNVPLLKSLSPLSGAAGSSLTLNGSNFASGATVKLGSVSANVVSLTANKIIVAMPSGLSLGEVAVSVTLGGFTTDTIPFTVTYGRPRLARLTPTSGPPGTPVYLAGTEFATPAKANTVRFGNTAANVLGGGPEGLLVSVPVLSVGGTNVTVTAAAASSDPLPFSVTSGEAATPVVISSITPDSGGAGTLVTIKGKGFSSTLANNVISFGDTSTIPVSASSGSLQIAIPFGLAAAKVDVLVTVDGYPSNPVSFNLNAPTPTPGPTVTGCTNVPNNLISWWRGNGDASDVKGANPGTLQGGATATTTGKVDKAFSFNGNGAYVSLGNPASLNLTGSMSIEGWINPSARPGENLLAAIMTKWAQDVGTGSSPDAYGLWIVNRNGTLKLFSALHKAGGGTEPNLEGGVIPLNTWSHVAVTFDASNGQYAIYVNGAAVEIVTSPGNNIASNKNVSIGREESYLPRYFTGLIDELAIYNRALSLAEIQAIHNAGAAGKCNATTVAPAVAQLQNISTRLQVGTGDSLAIGGFIVVGTGAKPVIVRALGPSLAKVGVAGSLSDPTLNLVNSNGESLIFNDDWMDGSQAQVIASTLPPGNESESTIIATVTPGAYTALLRGYNDATGVGLLELYDLDQGAPARLANISTRGLVGRDASVLIGGFIVGKQGKFVIRAIGPSLVNAGISNALQDPVLELYNASGTAITTNDNWKFRSDGSSQQAEIEATTIPPINDLESALVQILAPGSYTGIVRGKNNTTGVGVVEVYNLQ